MVDKILDAINHYDGYDHNQREGAISATRLLRPTRITKLIEIHGERETVKSNAVVGSLIHDKLEDVVNIEGIRKEERFYREVSGYTISGKFDLLIPLKDDIWQLADYKTSSVASLKNLNKHIPQLSIYKWILEGNGINVSDEAYIISILLDWRQHKHSFTDQFTARKLTLMGVEDTEIFIRSKLSELEQDTIPECSQDETWGGIRCKYYCPVKDNCDQYMESNARSNNIKEVLFGK